MKTLIDFFFALAELLFVVDLLNVKMHNFPDRYWTEHISPHIGVMPLPKITWKKIFPKKIALGERKKFPTFKITHTENLISLWWLWFYCYVFCVRFVHLLSSQWITWMRETRTQPHNRILFFSEEFCSMGAEQKLFYFISLLVVSLSIIRFWLFLLFFFPPRKVKIDSRK